MTVAMAMAPDALNYFELQTFPGVCGAVTSSGPKTVVKSKPAATTASVAHATATTTVYKQLDFVKTAAIHAQKNERVNELQQKEGREQA